MLPKLLDVPISTYLMVLAKIRRPSATPSASTSRSFSSRMTSAASLATSVAESTEIPTSAACSASASLTPSPRKATPPPVLRWTRTMRALSSGLTRAKPSWWRSRRPAPRRPARPARHRSARPVGEAEVAAHLDGHRRVVPGDDLHRDAQVGQPSQAAPRPAWAGRGRPAGRPASGRARPRRSARRAVGRRPGGDGDDPVAGGELGGQRVPRRAGHVEAAVQDRLGGAFGDQRQRSVRRRAPATETMLRS